MGDSNPRPSDYKSLALPTELNWLFKQRRHTVAICLEMSNTKVQRFKVQGSKVQGSRFKGLNQPKVVIINWLMNANNTNG